MATGRIRATFEDGSSRECASYTRVGELCPGDISPAGLPYLGALVNNEVSSLSYPLTADSEVAFLTIEQSHGWRIYNYSAAFILAKAVAETFPSAKFFLEHSFGTGLYCSFEDPSAPGKGITAEQLARIAARMREIVRLNLPILRQKLSYTQAVDRFRQSGQTDKLNLLRFRNPPRIVIHSCDGFSDLAHAPLTAHTGCLNVFELVHYPPGFVLQLPDRDDPKRLAPFVDQPHLFHIYQEHKEWGRILGVTTVGRLNEIIAAGEIAELMRVSEALHEKKVARIADEILGRKGRVRIILIAGPSCAGKTTFSKRLAVQLRVNGLQPVTIGMDDYFVDEEKTPRDANGDYDFEHLDAVDIDLFNRHMLQLLSGDEIEQPRFNFSARRREFRGERLHLSPENVLIVEGIHGLNPKLTHMVPAESKHGIYVSALTQLALDANNRISTTDNRLMRRLTRDSTFRGNTPLTTLKMWPSVRRGEKRWIFPYQGQANSTFNSALDYELAVLKPLVEPLLLEIKPSHAEYAEARRLAAFLSNFLAVSDREVPRTSILREYIGRSGFRY